MDHSPTPARRLRRPRWRDPRLGVGVVLVALAVLLGTWVVDRAGRTVEVYAAAGTLAPGDALAVEDLSATEVPPGALGDAYLLAADEVPTGAVLTRVVAAGELVPRSAVGVAADLDARPVTVTLRDGPPPGLAKGGLVDLWLTEAVQPGGLDDEPPGEPTVLAEALVVADVSESESIFAGTGGAAAQVLVPRRALPRVLGALAGEHEVVVIPVPGGP